MPRVKKEQRPVAIRMELDLYNRFNEFCKTSGQSKTVAIERAVAEYIDRYDEMMEKVKKGEE